MNKKKKNEKRTEITKNIGIKIIFRENETNISKITD